MPTRSVDDLSSGDEIIDSYVQDLVSRVEETDGAIFVAEHEARLISL